MPCQRTCVWDTVAVDHATGLSPQQPETNHSGFSIFIEWNTPGPSVSSSLSVSHVFQSPEGSASVSSPFLLIRQTKGLSIDYWILSVFVIDPFKAFEGLRAEECGILNGCENGRCVRVQEGYTCDCFDGYTLDLSRMTCIGKGAATHNTKEKGKHLWNICHNVSPLCQQMWTSVQNWTIGCRCVKTQSASTQWAPISVSVCQGSLVLTNPTTVLRFQHTTHQHTHSEHGQVTRDTKHTHKLVLLYLWGRPIHPVSAKSLTLTS